MNWLRRAVCWLFGCRAVILIDIDGEKNVRLVRQAPSGRLFCWRMFQIRRVFLEDGGRISPDCYVRRWEALPW